MANASTDFLDTLDRPSYRGVYGTPQEQDVIDQAGQIGRQQAYADLGYKTPQNGLGADSVPSAVAAGRAAKPPSDDPFQDPAYKQLSATRAQLADQERLYRQRVADFDRGEGADLKPFRNPDPNDPTTKYPSKFDYLGAQESAKWTGDPNINPPAVRALATQRQLLQDRRQRLVDEANRISNTRQQFDEQRFLPLRNRLLGLGATDQSQSQSTVPVPQDYLAPTGNDALSERIRQIQLRREATGDAPLPSGSVSGSGRFDETWEPVKPSPQVNQATPLPESWNTETAESVGDQTSEEPHGTQPSSPIDPSQVPELKAYTPPSLIEKAREGVRDFLAPIIGESDRQKLQRQFEQSRLENTLPDLAEAAQQSGNTTFQEKGLPAALSSFHNAPPVIGSEAAGTKGLLTIPKVQGDGIVAGAANAANSFTSGLTTPENIALAGAMEGVNGVRAAAPAVRLAAQATKAAATAVFAGQGIKGAYEAAKQAVEAIRDPNATKADVAQAITSGVLNAGLAVGAGHGTLEAAKAGIRDFRGGSVEPPQGGGPTTESPVRPTEPPASPAAASSETPVGTNPPETGAGTPSGDAETARMLAGLEASHALNRPQPGAPSPEITASAPSAEPPTGKPMPDDWRVTVWKMSPELPPAIQIDKIGHDGASQGSFSPEQLRKEGYAVPEVAQLPQGQYRAGDLSQHLEANPPPITTTTNQRIGEPSHANESGQQPTNDQQQHLGVPSGSDLRQNEGEVREGDSGQAGSGGGAIDRPGTSNQGGGEVGARGLPTESRASDTSPIPRQSDAGVRSDVTSTEEVPRGTPEALPRGPGFIAGTAAEQWADAKLKERAGQLSAGLDPELVAAHAIKGAAIIERGIRDFGAWSKEMVRQFGDTIRPHLDDIWKQTQSAIAGKPISGVPPAVNATVQSVGIRQRIANAVAKGNLTDAVAAGRDAVDNKANLYGREHTNEIRNLANQAFAKPDRAMAGDALTFAVEAGGTLQGLKEAAAKIASSDKAKPADAQRALAAIQFARDHLDQMKPLVDAYNTKTGQQLEAERTAGKDTPQYRNYVPHRQEVDDMITQLFGADGGGSGGGAGGFRHIRDFPTYADSIAAGMSPKSLNAFDLLQSRLAAGQRIINMGSWMDGLKGMKDLATKLPIVTEMDRRPRTNGPTDVVAPKGYSAQTINGRQIAVKEGYEGLLRKMVDPGFWSNDRVGRTIQQMNAIGKSSNLLLDSFHLGRLAFWNASTRLNAGGLLGGGADIPNPASYKTGLNLLDSTPADIVRRAQADGLTQPEIRARLADKRVLDMGVNFGLNVGRVSDALYQDLFHRALEKTGPLGKGVTGFQKWLFDKYQRGAMSEIYLMEFRRQRAMSGNADLPEATLARRVAKEVNTRFGNLGRQGIFKSRAGQDLARLLVLAPQWNEGLIKSEIHGALIDPLTSVAKAAVGKGLATSMLSRSMATAVVGQFVANQLINQYTRGKFTWENPEEGMGAKLSAWIPDTVGHGPGFFLHPMSIGAEISHLVSQRWDKTGSAREALDSFTRSRLSAAARPAATFILKTNSMGKTLRPGDVTTEAAKEALPLPIPTKAAIGAARSMLTGERSESFPGQFQKQLMSTVGLKTDQAPSDEQRIYGLASEYQRAKGIQQDTRNDVSDYTPLYTALRVGNRSDAETAMRDLLVKRTAKQVMQALQQHPRRAFSGKASNEADFIRSLSQEQRMTYNRARQQRADISNRAIALLRDYVARHPEANAPVQQ